eukprot:scaffold8224_cov118-Isochrysis_galbana.AAC.21
MVGGASISEGAGGAPRRSSPESVGRVDIGVCARAAMPTIGVLLLALSIASLNGLLMPSLCTQVKLDVGEPSFRVFAHATVNGC